MKNARRVLSSRSSLIVICFALLAVEAIFAQKPTQAITAPGQEPPPVEPVIPAARLEVTLSRIEVLSDGDPVAGAGELHFFVEVLRLNESCTGGSLGVGVCSREIFDLEKRANRGDVVELDRVISPINFFTSQFPQFPGIEQPDDRLAITFRAVEADVFDEDCTVRTIPAWATYDVSTNWGAGSHTLECEGDFLEPLHLKLQYSIRDLPLIHAFKPQVPPWNRGVSAPWGVAVTAEGRGFLAPKLAPKLGSEYPGSELRLNGSPVETTYLSSTSLKFTLPQEPGPGPAWGCGDSPSSYLRDPLVTVINPGPGGGTETSNGLRFDVACEFEILGTTVGVFTPSGNVGQQLRIRVDQIFPVPEAGRGGVLNVGDVIRTDTSGPGSPSGQCPTYQAQALGIPEAVKVYGAVGKEGDKVVTCRPERYCVARASGPPCGS